MFNLDQITRDNIKKLKPYSSARDEFSGEAKVFLDANENSLGSPLQQQYNRYPDPHQAKLKSAISKIKNVDTENIFLGNGSDECIDLLFRCFCDPGKDNVIINPPTYGMYEVAAGINDVTVKKISLTENFQLDVKSIQKNIDTSTKTIWICSPNNPTGNLINKKDILYLLQTFSGLVVIDEAYIDFANEASLISELNNFPNLVILQTFSKAWGLAALRLGMAFASKEIVQLLDKVKPPYNINGYTQEAAQKALQNKEKVRNNISEIIDLREELSNALSTISSVQKVYPSDANFLLVKIDRATEKYNELLENGIVVRDRSYVVLCDDCLRITVGTRIENQLLLDALSEKGSRIAINERNTNETKIKAQINIDGSGKSNIQTGLGFFDHMLEQICRHGQIDMTVRVDGDLEIDEHHTIEDVAIALGETFANALADKRGMERYGFALPMDDAEAKVLIDFGGRNWLVWNVSFNREKIGEVPTEMFFHFFKSFSDAAKCNLNIECKGENEHHKIEAIFKAFAKAIKMAVRKDPLSDYLPSTKGMI